MDSHNMAMIDDIHKRLRKHSAYGSYSDAEFNIVHRYLSDTNVSETDKMNFFKKVNNRSFYKNLMRVGYVFPFGVLAIEYKLSDWGSDAGSWFNYIVSQHPNMKFDTEFVEAISVCFVNVHRLWKFIKLGMDINLSKKWITRDRDLDVEDLVKMGLILQDQIVGHIDGLNPRTIVSLIKLGYKFPVTQELHDTINIIRHVNVNERKGYIELLEAQGACVDNMSVICSCADLPFLKLLKSKGANMALIGLDPVLEWHCPVRCSHGPDTETLVWLAKNGGPKLSAQQVRHYFGITVSDPVMVENAGKG